MKDTAILITTFLRDELLFRCMDSVRKYYPNIPIYIGDNGNHTVEKQEFCESLNNCTYLTLPFDCGVGGTRNEAIKRIPVKYKYLVIIEDDIIFTQATKLELWRKILDKESDVGIVGGLLKTTPATHQHYEAETWIEGEAHHIKRIDNPKWRQIGDIKYYLCDLILNVFMMRMGVFDEVKWDEQFKTAFEHSDFFLRLKYKADPVTHKPVFKDGQPILRKKPIKVAYAPDVWMYHQHGRQLPEYLKYRQRPVGYQLFARKWGVQFVHSSYNPTNPTFLKAMGLPHDERDTALDIAVRILERHGCKWWLACGTCLGAVRFLNFIHHDLDIDIGLPSEHLDLWDTFLKEFQDAGCVLYKEWTHQDQRIELSFKYEGIKLDLFFFFKKDEYMWHGVFGPDDRGHWTKPLTFYPYVFEASLFRNLKKIFFRGQRCFIPCPPDKYLTRLYGNWHKSDPTYRYWIDCQAIEKDFIGSGELTTKKIASKKTTPKKGTPHIAIGIKTFFREKNFFRVIKAIKENFPYPYRLYIADDGEVSLEKSLLYESLEKKGHVIIKLPFNCGLSVGRNTFLRQVNEDYVLIMDDDIEITDGKTICNMKTILDSDNDIGLVAGMLRCEGTDTWFGNNNYSQGMRFTFNDGMLIREPSRKPIEKVGKVRYRRADQIVNFFLAKREIFDDVKWDNRIKIEYEHMDFFLGLGKTKWEAAVCFDAEARHLKVDLSDPSWREYQHYRNSKPHQYFYAKHNIKRIVNRY